MKWINQRLLALSRCSRRSGRATMQRSTRSAEIPVSRTKMSFGTQPRKYSRSWEDQTTKAVGIWTRKKVLVCKLIPTILSTKESGRTTNTTAEELSGSRKARTTIASTLATGKMATWKARVCTITRTDPSTRVAGTEITKLERAGTTTKLAITTRGSGRTTCKKASER